MWTPSSRLLQESWAHTLENYCMRCLLEALQYVTLSVKEDQIWKTIFARGKELNTFTNATLLGALNELLLVIMHSKLYMYFTKEEGLITHTQKKLCALNGHNYLHN